MAAVPANKIYSVYQINRMVDDRLRSDFSDIWVVGEVSNFKAYPSGHLYFVLKDERSQIQAICFRESAQRLKFQLKDGDLIIGHGRVEVYVPNGRYQLILDTIEPKGLGALQRAFEELKRKLEKEGLFKAERKRPIPKLPRVIGIVTSPVGAAIHDMLRTLELHHAHLKVLIYPVPVQGEGAAEQIARAIWDMNTIDEVELLIVGRGGGSWEDLWPFNEEVVARAIAGSRVPVVTGIGHEVDWTIADFVADFRAATPTAAAAVVARGWEEFEQRLDDLWPRMNERVQEFIFEREQEIEALIKHRGFELVYRRLSEAQYQIELLMNVFSRVVNQKINTCFQDLNLRVERLNRQNPVARVMQWRVMLETFSSRLDKGFSNIKTPLEARLTKAAVSLDALSPLAQLARGYAICQKPDGGVVMRVDDVQLEDEVKVRVADGRLDCQVKNKMKGV
ncbi:exodeoxyribonuclease VII large subunit [candidate division WOR-3 bacterium]|nr:exodeoxyribonuclease VII large subunit [candidate division WOR-3 bacterium]